jgi:raffinose/stachyose/melibiose transport system permease protein
MKAQGVTPLAFPGIYLYYADMFLKSAYYNLAGAAGYQAYLDLAPGARSGASFKRAAAILQRLAFEDFQPGWQGASHTAAQVAFFEGKTAMMGNGSWLVSEMQGKIPAGFELGAFALPVFSDGAGSPNALQVGSEYYFAFAKRPHVRETVDFLKFLTSRANAGAATRALDTPTAIRGVAASDYSPGMRDVAAIIARADAAFGDSPGTAAPHPELEQAYSDARFQLLTGKITPDQFGDHLEAAAETERQLAENPDHIESRHSTAAAVLLGALAVAIAAVAVTQVQAARKPRPRDTLAPAARMSWRNAALFILPSLLIYALFVIKPSGQAFIWSFREWDGVTAPHFVGLLNFKRTLLESDTFWHAMRNNLFLMVVPTLFVLPLSLFFAAIISRGVWGSRVYRVCFFFPNILGGIAVTLLWMNAYEPTGGLVNGALVSIGYLLQALPFQPLAAWFLGFKDYAWLSQDHLYWSLIPMAIWGGCGFNMILYLAAMESVDESYYEAARIEGASALRQFFQITVPLIWEVLVVTIVFSFIGGLKAFESIWLLTSQQPTTETHVIGTLMISKLFNDFRVGEATAIAVILFGLVFFGTVALLRITKRENHASV